MDPSRKKESLFESFIMLKLYRWQALYCICIYIFFERWQFFLLMNYHQIIYICNRTDSTLLRLPKIFYIFFYFIRSLGIFVVFFWCRCRIRDPAPGHMRYSYFFIASALRVWCRSVQAYQARNSCGVGLFLTTSESGLPSLYIYGLHC